MMAVKQPVPPKETEFLPGQFTFPEQVTVRYPGGHDLLPARRIVEHLKNKHKTNIRIEQEAAAPDVFFGYRMQLHDPEAYELRINRDSIEILASSQAGFFYGSCKLIDLIQVKGLTLGCRHIRDWPLLKRRIAYLDCARGKVPTPQTVKSLIERLAHWRINELQLYIENSFAFRLHPDISEHYSPYTAAEILDIQAHARRYHVKLVPSLTSFGHFEKILALPTYRHLAELEGFDNHPGGTTLCPIDPDSIKLVQDLYREFLPLFEALDFNICCDEPWELGKGRSKQLVEQVGLGRVYMDFVMKLREMAIKHGKRVNMWGDILMRHTDLLPMLPSDVVVLNWDYDCQGPFLKKNSELANQRIPFVSCAGTHSWQSCGGRLQTGLKCIYEHARSAAEYGAEGIMVTDWGDMGHRNPLGVSLCGLMYGGVLGWAPGTVSPEEHIECFCHHMFGECDTDFVRILKTIGDDELEGWTYHALVEKMKTPETATINYACSKAVIDQIPLSNERVVEKLRQQEALEIPTTAELHERHISRFERIAALELELARDMNVAALRRILIVRAYRTGQVLKRSDLEHHRAELFRLEQRFYRTWMLRNKPSRVADNLEGFRVLIDEIDQLA